MKTINFLVLISFFTFISCTSESNDFGGIYGIVTNDNGVAEGVPVLLYKYTDTHSCSLLASTTTFEDGHFEFVDLYPERYRIKAGPYYSGGVKLYSYDEDVLVESNRISRIDVKVR